MPATIVEHFFGLAEFPHSAGDPCRYHRRAFRLVGNGDDRLHIFGPGGKNFLSNVVSLAERGEKIKAISDYWGTPTYGRDLANRLRELAQLDLPGVYHVVDDDPSPVSRWLPAFSRWVGASPPPRVTEQEGRVRGGEDAYTTARSSAVRQTGRQRRRSASRLGGWNG